MPDFFGEDLSVNGPGSPVSLQRVLFEHPISPITFLIDGTGSGIAHDAKDVLYITPEECTKQALYFTQELFDGARIPGYLYRYLSFLMLEEDGNTMEYPDDQVLQKAFESGKITKESEDYKFICNFITYCKDNPEAQQLIGLIQLISGSLNVAKKQNAGIKLYLDRPETALHPKRQARFMSALMEMRREYGGEE